MAGLRKATLEDEPLIEAEAASREEERKRASSQLIAREAGKTTRNGASALHEPLKLGAESLLLTERALHTLKGRLRFLRYRTTERTRERARSVCVVLVGYLLVVVRIGTGSR